MSTHKKIRNTLVFSYSIMLIVIIFSTVAMSKEHVDITIKSDSQQKFYGYGIGLETYEISGYRNISETNRKKMANIFFNNSIRPEYLKISYDTSISIKDVEMYYKDIMKVISVVSHFKMIFETPQFYFGSKEAKSGLSFEQACDKWSTDCVNWLAELKNNTNVPVNFNYVSVVIPVNSTNSSDTNNISSSYLQIFKHKLDSLKIYPHIIASSQFFERNNINNVQVILKNMGVNEQSVHYDTSAGSPLNFISGFGTESFEFSISDKMEETVQSQIKKNNKILWVTNGSGGGEYDQKGLASNMASKFLADMNHLCGVWVINSGFRNTDNPIKNSTFVWAKNNILYSKENRKEPMPEMAYYYFKQLQNTIRTGAIMHKSIADFGYYSFNSTSKYWRREDTTMTVAFGETAPLYLAAGKNTDNTWGIAITNYTGFEQGNALHTPREKMSYSITVKLENAPSGDIKFYLSRLGGHSTKTNKDTLIMHNGVLEIDSIGQFELITLQSESKSGAVSIIPQNNSSLVKQCGLTVENSQNNVSKIIKFNVSSNNPTPVNLSIYSTCGQKLVSIVNKSFNKGRYKFNWNGTNNANKLVPAGMYFVRLKIGNKILMKEFNIIK